jgi:hypothetical protein
MTKVYEAQKISSVIGERKIRNQRTPKLQTAQLQPEELLKSVLTSFSVKNSNVVSRFLQDNLFLVNLIVSARSKITDYFGQSIPLALSVTQSPDEEDAELYLLIQTKLSAQAALPILEKFEESWWLNVLPQAQCKMTIKLEYV